jgi:6-phosphogluconolactonase (cycloisomerase 2 family)
MATILLIFLLSTHTGGISAYRIDRSTGVLELVNSVPSNGSSPARIKINKNAK